MLARVRRNQSTLALLMKMSNDGRPRKVWLFLIKLDIQLPCGPAIARLDISPGEVTSTFT